MPCRTRDKDAGKRPRSVHENELNYQNQVHKTEVVVHEEEQRRLRVRKHLLRDEVQDLQEQITEKNAKIGRLSSELEEARATADSDRLTHGKTQKQLQLQNRKLVQLQTELDALNTTTRDSAKHLREKLALSRELDILKPEVDHLRSQLEHLQLVISEKHSLERQLNTAEVELAAEKKARQESAKRDGEKQDVDAELRRQLKETEKQLTSEKRETERLRQLLKSQAVQSESSNKVAEQDLMDKLQSLQQELDAERRNKDRITKEADVSLAEAQAKMEMLEQRLDTMKSKLRTTQSELKTAKMSQKEPQQLKPSHQKMSARSVATKQQIGRKRAAQDMSIADHSIDSPESDDTSGRKMTKKRAADSTLLGEKSLFSVTPFLNRNKNLSMDALLEEDDEDAANTSHIPQQHAAAEAHETQPLQQMSADEEPGLQSVTEPLEATEGAQLKSRKPRGRPRKVLADSSTNIALSTAVLGKKAQMPLPALAESVSEIPGTDRIDAVGAVESGAASAEHSTATKPATNGEVVDTRPRKREPDLKKKRKLVADTSKTIFDEPEDEVPEAAAKRTGKVQLKGPGRVLGKQKMGLGRLGLGGSTFSPLKKDRRGVGASFLA